MEEQDLQLDYSRKCQLIRGPSKTKGVVDMIDNFF